MPPLISEAARACEERASPEPKMETTEFGANGPLPWFDALTIPAAE